ncbi:MAG: lasso peptide biosynthesis B2 protein [Gammaproteobacteria bacterium]|nr:lasso peptide biosynthesis B2 protein [Gammaproteobacteria bacterium]
MLNKFELRLSQVRNLTKWERQAFVHMAWILPTVWVLLRTLGFKKMLGMVEKEAKFSLRKPLPEGVAQEDYAQRCAQITEIAARHGLYQANCLHQSLALCGFLRYLGLQARLKIGVLPGSEPFQAHAWVELDDTPLGRSVVEYHAFSKLDAWRASWI